jgi:hypothetical protein
MTNKYFNYQGAPWQIIETPDPWGTPMVYAIEMNSTDGAMLNTEQYSEGSDWEYVEATDVRIDEWFLRSDPTDLFEAEDEYDEQYEKEHDDPNHPPNIKPLDSSKLKAMLEGLRKPIFDESRRTLGEAADILGMIRARNSDNTTSADIRVLSEKQLALLNQSDAEYELLNIDAQYMALVRKLG